MKNLKIFALAAFALLGFAACQQEELVPQKTTHTVTFVAGAPETTKTTVDISDKETAKFAWTKADEGRFTVYENGVAATKVEAGITGEVMSMLAEFSGDVPSSPKYQALFNSEVSATQIVPKNSYAETTDVMVSEVLDGSKRDDEFVFRFKREVAFAKMTLKGLTNGACVSSVKIESDKPIAGKYDLKTGTFIEPSNVITLDVLNDVVEGNATVWFTTIPVENATFTITAETTDDAETVAGTYTKTFTKTITLSRGDVKPFSVAMEPTVVAKPWVAVDLADIDETMPVVITMATSSKVYALSLTDIENNALGTSASPKAIAVNVANEKLSEEPTSDIIWNIANTDGNLTIYPDGVTSKWLYTTSSNSGVRLGTNTSNGYVWSIDTKSGYLKANANSSEVRYLGVYVDGTKGPDWRAYTNTTGNTKDQTLCFYSNSNASSAPRYAIAVNPVTGGTLSASPVKAEAGAEVTLTATPAEGYAFNNDWTVKDADETAITVTADGKFNMPAKNVTVSGSFSKVDYTITKATCEGGSFTVKKEGGEVTKAQFGETITLEAIAADGYEFSSWTVTNESTSKTVYVNENTFTMPGANVTVEANFVELAVVPVYASLKDLVNAGEPSKTETYVTVTLTNDEITGIYTTSSGGYRNGVYFMVGTQEIEIYCKNVPEAWIVGGYVSGTLTNCAWKLYGSTWELCPTDWNELTYAAPCETPVITLDGASATIECATVDATIRYTTDGTDPNETSAEYTGAVTLEDGQTIKAKAFLDGHKPSDIASKKYTAGSTSAKDEKTATISFGTNLVKIDKQSVSGSDDCNNSWTITTVGTTSFTPSKTYCQIGSKSSVATSITFTTTLPSDAEVSSIEGKFGGFSGTAGDVSLKVGDTEIGSGALSGTTDVTVTSTNTADGNVVTVSITGISKGVKCYYIKVVYKTAE